VPDVRIVAGKMFASSALTGGTALMLVFSTPTNFTGPGPLTDPRTLRIGLRFTF
jgi:hypothetical protein